MSDDLFPKDAHSGPDRLTAARTRMANAEDAYRLADAFMDESGDPIPGEIARELREARSHLAATERERWHP